MEIVKEYILQNWILVLILSAFAIILGTTAFLDKKATRRMYELIGFIFILSILVFIEFLIDNDPQYRSLRLVLMAIRYSATPIIIAQVLFALVKKLKAFIFIPALITLAIDIISIFTGIVFSVDDAGELQIGDKVYLCIHNIQNETRIAIPIEVDEYSVATIKGLYNSVSSGEYDIEFLAQVGKITSVYKAVRFFILLNKE